MRYRPFRDSMSLSVKRNWTIREFLKRWPKVVYRTGDRGLGVMHHSSTSTSLLQTKVSTTLSHSKHKSMKKKKIMFSTSNCCGISCMMSFCGHWSVFLFAHTNNKQLLVTVNKCFRGGSWSFSGHSQVFSLVDVHLTRQRARQFGGWIHGWSFGLLQWSNTEGGGEGRREEWGSEHSDTCQKSGSQKRQAGAADGWHWFCRLIWIFTSGWRFKNENFINPSTSHWGLNLFK